MDSPKICLTLTGKTIQEDLDILEKYRDYIDIAELRADYLDDNERLFIRNFPRLAGIPCILTIRRKLDGGNFVDGESARTILFARALAFADSDKSKNYEYIDFEEDFHIPSLQDAALAFGIKIIRSVHNMTDPIYNIGEKLESLRTTGYEIPKIAFMPHTLKDVQRLFEEASKLKDDNHIVVAMGPLGTPSRILSAKLGNYLTYTSAVENASNTQNIGHMDPVTLCNTYNFRSIDENTELYGITGFPLTATSSPLLHNGGYKAKNINAVYIPIRAERIEDALSFSSSIGMKGLSVTVPHKEKVTQYLSDCDAKVQSIGACNTIVWKTDGWHGYNTDAVGFERALLAFLNCKNLRYKKVAVIGAGGAAKAICYTIKKLHGDACIFNRTLGKAKLLAEQFGFEYAPLGSESLPILKKYNSIMIQTTSKGMGSEGAPNADNDPLYFYNFTGKESLFDIVYVPEVTPVMARAKEAGCQVCNGYQMLLEQGYEQFELFTGEKYCGN